MAWCDSAAAILPLPPGTDALRPDPDHGTEATQDPAPAVRPVASRTFSSLASPWLSLANLRGCLRELTSIGSNVKMAVIDQPLPVEHCPSCGAGFSRTMQPAVVARLTNPAW